MTDRSQKAFPVSWDQFHRDARALAWRLASSGPFTGLVAITRGGLVPAAIIARELDLRDHRDGVHRLLRSTTRRRRPAGAEDARAAK